MVCPVPADMLGIAPIYSTSILAEQRLLNAAFSLYAFLGFLMDGPASLLTSLIGLEIAPHFNRPYYSESVASFWGKRWNLTVSNCLRAPIFDPVTEGMALLGIAVYLVHIPSTPLHVMTSSKLTNTTMQLKA